MIKYDEKKKVYRVSYSRRHPVTKEARSLTRTGIKTMEEAKKTYKYLIIQLEKKFNLSQYPLWPEIVERFIEHFRNRGIANNTVYNYKTGLYSHTIHRWGKKQINEITTSDIRELVLDHLSDKSEALRKDILKYIRATFTYAVDMGIIQRDPTPKLKFKKTFKIKSVLKENEILYFLKMAKEKKHPWFPIWTMALYTGMRNGELYALKWEKVDLNNRLMIVCISWNQKNGFKETKSGDDRVVEIAESLMPLMEELFKNKNSDFVLPRFDTWDMNEQARVLRAFLKEINLPLVRFHDLRASWATVMLSKGVEPIKVMAMGGWRDLKTLQIYVRKSGINIQGITNHLNFLQEGIE